MDEAAYLVSIAKSWMLLRVWEYNTPPPMLGNVSPQVFGSCTSWDPRKGEGQLLTPGDSHGSLWALRGSALQIILFEALGLKLGIDQWVHVFLKGDSWYVIWRNCFKFNYFRQPLSCLPVEKMIRLQLMRTLKEVIT